MNVKPSSPIPHALAGPRLSDECHIYSPAVYYSHPTPAPNLMLCQLNSADLAQITHFLAPSSTTSSNGLESSRYSPLRATARTCPSLTGKISTMILPKASNRVPVMVALLQSAVVGCAVDEQLAVALAKGVSPEEKT